MFYDFHQIRYELQQIFKKMGAAAGGLPPGAVGRYLCYYLLNLPKWCVMFAVARFFSLFRGSEYKQMFKGGMGKVVLPSRVKDNQ